MSSMSVSPVGNHPFIAMPTSGTGRSRTELHPALEFGREFIERFLLAAVCLDVMVFGQRLEVTVRQVLQFTPDFGCRHESRFAYPIGFDLACIARESH